MIINPSTDNIINRDAVNSIPERIKTQNIGLKIA